MKKIVEHITICIIVTYFILSLVFSGYYFITTRNEVEELNIVSSKDNTIHQETINLGDNLTIGKLLKMNYLNGKMGIIISLGEIMVISSVIGFLLGLLISLKENSKIKYILFFILGNVLYNGILVIVMQFIYWKNNISFNLLESYKEAFKMSIFLYCLTYGVLIVIKIVYNKYKVKKLNGELNKKIANK